MTTNWAFFCSTNLVTVLVPQRTKFGFFLGWTSLPLALASAIFLKRCFLARTDSGRYFSSNLNSFTAVVLSRACWNWWIGGGTFKRFWSTAFCRWIRMYFGHFTKRDRSRFGWMFWPKSERERWNKGWFPRNPRYIQEWEDETKSISNIQALRGALSFPQFYSPSFFSFSTEKSRCYKYLHSIWLGFYFFLVRLKLPTYQCQNSWDASQTTDWPPSWPLVSWWPEELEPPSWWPASSSV